MKQLRTFVAIGATLAASSVVFADVQGDKVDGGTFRRYILVEDFAPTLDSLVSGVDLINGFGVNSDDACSGGVCTVGLPINQAINESAIAPYTIGWIDPFNGIDPSSVDPNALPGIGSWFMASSPSDVCRQMFYNQPSDGFQPGVTGNGGLADFVDGVAGSYVKSVLRDFGRASLVVRYGFDSPTDIGRLRVFAGNLADPMNPSPNGRDGRVFQYYDVYARTGDCSGGNCPAGPNDTDGFDEFFLVAERVTTGEPGFVTNDPGSNPTPFEGTMTDVVNFNSDILIEGCTDLRVVFYCVSNTQGLFIDPWQGYENEIPALADFCTNGLPPDSAGEKTVVGVEDGYVKAFQAPIIKEIDVFGEIATPVADIDYDDDFDLFDMAAMQRCFNADVTTNGCYRFDANTNGAFALDDYAALEPLVTGPQ